MKQLLTFFLLTFFLLGSSLDDAKKLFDANKYTKAVRIFITIQDNPEVQYYLGKAYYYGLGVEKDEDKAFNNAQQSAIKKFPAGLNLLGVFYENGVGVKEDDIEALLYYRQAAKLGNTFAMNNIGRFYQQGYGLNQNYDKAIEWFAKAIKANDPMGYYYIADTHYHEYKDYENAVKYYLEFLKRKTKVPEDVYENLGDSYRNLEQYQNAYKNYKKSAEQDRVTAMISLYLLIDKFPKLAQSKYEGLNWLKKAAEHNNKDAEIFLYGQYMFRLKDYVKAKELAEKAYENGNAELGCELASQYTNSVFKWRDPEKAYVLASTIIEKNPPSSELSVCYVALSTLYRKGWYVEKNISKAIEILEKQYAQSSGLSLQLTETIATLYLEELNDFKNAEKWYKITYEMTKDSKYLTKVEEYKSKLPSYLPEIKNDAKLEVFPIIDSFNSKDQVTTALESKKYYFLATSQKGINIYDKKTLKFIKELRGKVGKSSDGKILQMAYDEKKHQLFYSGLNSETDMSKNEIIRVFDIDSGKIVRTINSSKATTITYMDLSADGRYLGTIGRGVLLNIIDLDNNQTQTYDFSNKTQILALKIDKVKDDYQVKVVGTDKNLYTVSVKQKRQVDKTVFSSQVMFKVFNAEDAQKIFSSAAEEKIEKLTIQNRELYIKRKDIQKFSFAELKLVPVKSKISFESNNSSTIDVKIINFGKTLEIYNDKKLLTSLEFLTLTPVIYKVIKNKYIVVSIRESNIMMLFNVNGRPIAQLSGSMTMQTQMIVGDDYFVTYGSDNIIHIWNLDNLSSMETKKKEYDQEILQSMNKALGGNILEILNDQEFIKKMGEGWAKQYAQIYQLPFVPEIEQILSSLEMILLKKEEINPQVSLYIKNNDWIVYNAQGVFASSENGKNLMRYHVNQGENKEAKIIGNDQLFEKFYRPDIIRKLLAKEDVNIDIDIRSIIFNIKPPSVDIVRYALKDKKDLSLTYKVCDKGNGVSNISLIVNGIEKSLKTSRGFILQPVKQTDETCQLLQDIITLEPGRNKVVLQAYDKEKIIVDRSKVLMVDANYTIVKKPNLYFVSIAVSDYKDISFKLKYAVNDVLSVEKSIQSKSKNIFSGIHTYRLHDKDVNKKNLSSLFEKISKEIEVNDVFMLYVAGHGVSSEKDGLFYFLPYDMKNNVLESGAISVNEIKSELNKINTSKFLILLDTCNSGSFIDNKNIGDETLSRLSQGGKRNYIVASSKTQVALEGYKGYGVFTYTVLEAFKNAYYPGNTLLSVGALADYVERNVPKITKEEFHYEQTPEKYLYGKNFDIAEKQE